jgi:hypothetical protein
MKIQSLAGWFGMRGAMIIAVSVLALISCACAEVDPADISVSPSAQCKAVEPCAGASCVEQCLAGPLIESGSASYILDCSRIWIKYGSVLLSDISLPRYTKVPVEMVPAQEGYLTLLERVPSGSLKSLFKGYVYPGHRYQLWFCAEDIGTHEIWYHAGLKESNRVRFYVLS